MDDPQYRLEVSWLNSDGEQFNRVDGFPGMASCRTEEVDPSVVELADAVVEIQRQFVEEGCGTARPSRSAPNNSLERTVQDKVPKVRPHQPAAQFRR